MNQPDVLFAAASDGVTIAYWTIGSGPPLLITQNFGLNHAELEWTVPSLANLYTELANHHQVIRFNPRGSGLSDRGLDLDYSADALGLDIETVIDAGGFDRVALLATQTMGPIAIRFAARHPDRVSHLILCDTYANVTDTAHSRFLDAQQAMRQVHESIWELWGELAGPGEAEELYALSDAAGVEEVEPVLDLAAWDARPSLGAVEAPTLVLLSRLGRYAALEESKQLATGIPKAQMKSLEGKLLPYFADHEAVRTAIESFLGTATATPPMSRSSGFTTVVFTDIVASTEMLSRLGDEAGRAAVRAVEGEVIRLSADHGGEVIKNLGDGSMVAFPSTSGALAFAVALQAAMSDSTMALRIGISVGEPIYEDGDLHGAVVAQASRVADQGSAGEIMVADSVRQLALGKGFEFEAAGDATLKGFKEPLRLWKVTGP